ncbi:unnamed protein product, partial [Medioppia subpectinata]
MPVLKVDYNLIETQLKEDKEAKESVDVIDGIDGDTDLIANQYEGGFKIWEGLQDIIDYFIECKIFDNLSNNENLNVLELGCGSGLASIYCS